MNRQRVAGSLIGGVVATMLAVSPVMADGLHLFNNDPNFAWSKGCKITYSLAADVPEPYVTAITDALGALSGPTSMTFTRVPDNALISYSIDPTLPSGVSGIGSTMGTVRLAPLGQLPDWQDPAINADIRKNLVVHETMHVFGIAHDLDENDPNGPDEIMYPILTVGPLHFGNGDLTGLEYIKKKNRCGTSNEVKPGGETTGPPIITPPKVTSVAHHKCLLKNQKVWKWNVKKKKCVRRH